MQLFYHMFYQISLTRARWIDQRLIKVTQDPLQFFGISVPFQIGKGSNSMQQSVPLSNGEWTPRRVMLATLTVLGVVILFALLIRFRLVFFSLFTAIVLSTAFKPLINFMARRGMSRAVSIILIALLLLGLLIVLAVTVVPLLAQQGTTLTILVSGWYREARQALMESPSMLLRRIARQLPFFLNTTLPAPSVEGAVEENTIDLVQRAANITTIVLRGVLVTLNTLLLTSFWILEGERAKRFLLMAFQPPRRDVLRDLLDEMENKVGSYTRGLGILSFIIGAVATIAYMIIGLPNALLLGIIAGVMEAVPLVGPTLGAIPALLVAATVDPTKLVWVIVATVVIQTLENNLIVPRVMDRAVGVNPVVSLLAFLAFGSIFGFLGALLAIPLAAVIQIALRRFVFRTSTSEGAPTILRRDAVSALRYETQDLAEDVRKQVRDKETELDKETDQVEDSIEAIVSDLDSILAQVELETQQKAPRRRREDRQ